MPGITTALPFQAEEAYARRLDAEDALSCFRDRFLLPQRSDGSAQIYLCGHSLGLQPKSARLLIEEELSQWARLGVEGHFQGKTPWFSYHELLRDAGARLIGALPQEVVFMNSLTVNLHLLLATFYRPSGERRSIVMDEPAFPSDRYALQSQVRHHGLDPSDCLLAVRPRQGEHLVREEDLEDLLERRGPEVAVVVWNAVNFLTGQFFDLPRLTQAAQRHGCLMGLDLAHAAGNVPLALHEWGVDFAVWCSYKYLNGGPGAVGGAFVHERHGRNLDLPRLAGWWGNDPATRFRMQLQPDFIPREGADGWQVSNPPILSIAPLRASLELFDLAGMEALRAKSQHMTAYLLYLLENGGGPTRFEVLTSRQAARRGSQISLLVHDRPREVLRALEATGVVADFREPNIVRAAAAPLYNSYRDLWQFAQALQRAGPTG
jgi:kynureninase